jgi:hypothetical protein
MFENYAGRETDWKQKLSDKTAYISMIAIYISLHERWKII